MENLAESERRRNKYRRETYGREAGRAEESFALQRDISRTLRTAKVPGKGREQRRRRKSLLENYSP